MGILGWIDKTAIAVLAAIYGALPGVTMGNMWVAIVGAVANIYLAFRGLRALRTMARRIEEPVKKAEKLLNAFA